MTEPDAHEVLGGALVCDAHDRRAMRKGEQLLHLTDNTVCSPVRHYHVSLHMSFDATSPEDAVAQMAAWVADNAITAGYRVTWPGDDGVEDTAFIDAERIDLGGLHED